MKEMKNVILAAHAMDNYELDLRNLDSRIFNLQLPTYETWLVNGSERQLYTETEKLTWQFKSFLDDQGIRVEKVEIPAPMTDELRELIARRDEMRRNKKLVKDRVRVAALEVIKKTLNTPEKIWATIEGLNWNLYYDAHDEGYDGQIQLSSVSLLELLATGKMKEVVTAADM